MFILWLHLLKFVHKFSIVKTKRLYANKEFNLGYMEIQVIQAIEL